MAVLKGKKCFVTGAAGGIGSRIVKSFYNQGATVGFCDIKKEAGETLAKTYPGIYFYYCDVKNAEELENTITKFYEQSGGLDVIINNAGISKFSPLQETSWEDFDEIIDTNLRPVFITGKIMRKFHNQNTKGYGRIINISSTRFMQSEAGSEGYAASKGGIVSLTHALALSFSGTGITVNSISPGWIETGDYSLLTENDHSQHPSGRVGNPDDIARACLFLAEPENDFINGQNIIIDGGMTRKMIYTE